MSSVIVSKLSNSAFRIILNRPKALNALSLDMIRAMTPEVRAWSTVDSPPAMVLMEGEGDRAFCAGGDVKSLWETRTETGLPSKEQADFFREEYQLDSALAGLKDIGVQQVVFYDGITMGGGVGVSIHAPFRIATEATVFAMPETAIGFFPDVAGSYFLPRLPGSFGMYLALTGARVKGSEAVTAGLATHYVPRERLTDLRESLVSAVTDLPSAATQITDVLASFAEPVDASASALGAQSGTINRTFDKATVEDILTALEEEAKAGGDSGEWAGKTLGTLGKMSPTSLKITHEQITRGAAMTLDQCFTMEYNMAMACMQGNDFYEGVCSVLVDKSHVPKWSPESVPAVTRDLVERHFVSTTEAGIDEWTRTSSRAASSSSAL